MHNRRFGAGLADLSIEIVGCFLPTLHTEGVDDEGKRGAGHYVEQRPALYVTKAVDGHVDGRSGGDDVESFFFFSWYDADDRGPPMTSR